MASGLVRDFLMVVVGTRNCLSREKGVKAEQNLKDSNVKNVF